MKSNTANLIPVAITRADIRRSVEALAQAAGNPNLTSANHKSLNIKLL